MLYNINNCIHLPAEWEPHDCCILGWAVPASWGSWAPAVEKELGEVIETISRFEPVRLLTPASKVAPARSRFAGCAVDVIEAPIDDIWMRDLASTVAMRAGRLVAMEWRQRPDGTNASAGALAQWIAHTFGMERALVPFSAEGGAFITDGEGALITTRSCLLDPSRNPVSSAHRQREIECALERLGMFKVIWLEGDPSEPITNGHVDGYVLFAAPGRVLVESIDDGDTQAPFWREHDIALLAEARDAYGRKIQIQRVLAPRRRYWKFRGANWAPCYLNAYVANGAVITGCFGDRERDELAKQALAAAFPGREVVMLKIDHIANGGGGVHCLTQPAPRSEGGKDGLD